METADLVTALRNLEQTIQVHNKALLKFGAGAGKSAKSTTSGQKNLKILDEKRIVYIRTVFVKVGEIDTIKENFIADVFIQAKWKEPLLNDIAPDKGEEDIDWESYWSPQLYIQNAIGDPKETVWHTLQINEDGEAVVCEKRRAKGVFMEKMELKEFPFDTQDLTVTLASELLEQEVDLQEDVSEFSTVNVQSFVDEQEWRLRKHVNVTKKTLTSEFVSVARKPVLSASCVAQRRPGFFIWNILLVMLFICSLAFATFTVSMVKPQNRLQLSFTLVLTCVAFKFVANQSLPKISYLTYLDKYILTSMGTLFTICVWHAIIPYMLASGLSGLSNESLPTVDLISNSISNLLDEDLKLAMQLDTYAILIIGLFYFVFHVVFFTVIFVQSYRRRARYAEAEEKHEERMTAVKTENQQPIAKSISLISTSSKSKVDPLL